MKNLDEMNNVITHLIERMNRIEAMQAMQTQPSGEKIVIDIDTSVVTECINVLERALNEIELRKAVTLNGH
jgi:hypothetical protein